MKATLNINRTSGEDQHIEISIKLGMGRTITAEIGIEQFALAITGMSENPVNIRTRNVDLVLAPAAKRKKDQPHDQ